jgi:hypothetical protein
VSLTAPLDFLFESTFHLSFPSLSLSPASKGLNRAVIIVTFRVIGYEVFSPEFVIIWAWCKCCYIWPYSLLSAVGRALWIKQQSICLKIGKQSAAASRWIGCGPQVPCAPAHGVAKYHITGFREIGNGKREHKTFEFFSHNVLSAVRKQL